MVKLRNMMNFKKIFFLLVFINLIFYIYPENTSDNNVTVGAINFNGIKVTSPKYLLSIIPIQKGSVWNDQVKLKLENVLKGITSIIEKVDILEEPKENNVVDITINIVEKGAFIIVPFFKYGLVSGFQPKLIFRHYNVGGYKKYLNIKSEFLPRTSFNFYTKYKDPDVLNNARLSYEIIGEFKFSAINYYANYDEKNGNSRDTPPLGVLGGDQEEKWNDEFFFLWKLKGKFTYKIPNIEASVSPDVEIEYKRLLAQDGAENLPIDKIIPKMGLGLSFPIKSINAYIKPSVNVRYNLTLGNENLAISEDEDITEENMDLYTEDLEKKFYGNAYDSLKPDIKLGFSFLIPIFNARIDPFIKIVYERVINYSFQRGDIYSGNTGFIVPGTEDHFLDLIIGLDFNKSFNFRKSKHSFKINTDFELRLIGDAVLSRDYGIKNYPFNFKSKLDFYYELDINTYKFHHFKMKWTFFARYNQIKIYGSGYKIGSNPGDLYGFLGIVGNFKYELPFFNVNTP